MFCFLVFLLQMAITTFNNFASVEPDLIWLSLNDLYCPEELTPPHEALRPVKLAGTGAQSKEYAENVTALLSAIWVTTVKLVGSDLVGLERLVLFQENLLMRHLNSLSYWPRCSRVSPPEQEVSRECDCPVISGMKVKDLVYWHYIWIVKSFATDYHLKSWKLANIHVIPGCLRSGNFIPSRGTSLNWTAAIN